MLHFSHSLVILCRGQFFFSTILHFFSSLIHVFFVTVSQSSSPVTQWLWEHVPSLKNIADSLEIAARASLALLLLILVACTRSDCWPNCWPRCDPTVTSVRYSCSVITRPWPLFCLCCYTRYMAHPKMPPSRLLDYCHSFVAMSGSSSLVVEYL